MSKLFIRAETLKKMQRSRVPSSDYENSDVIDIECLAKFTEKVSKKKQIESPDKIRVKSDSYNDIIVDMIEPMPRLNSNRSIKKSEQYPQNLFNFHTSTSMQQRKAMQSRQRQQHRSQLLDIQERHKGVQRELQSEEEQSPNRTSIDYFPPRTAHGGSRMRDYNRLSHLNPKNDRNTRLSSNFSSSRGFV